MRDGLFTLNFPGTGYTCSGPALLFQNNDKYIPKILQFYDKGGFDHRLFLEHGDWSRFSQDWRPEGQKASMVILWQIGSNPLILKIIDTGFWSSTEAMNSLASSLPYHQLAWKNKLNLHLFF